MVEADNDDIEIIERVGKSVHQFADHSFCLFSIKNGDIDTLEKFLKKYAGLKAHVEDPMSRMMEPQDIMLMKPGATARPRASISSFARAAGRESTAAMVSPRIATSHTTGGRPLPS